MKYVAIFVQSGQGCDYTIACGQKSIIFDAIADDVAHEYAINQIRENYGPGDYQLELVYLFRVGEQINIDLKSLYGDMKAERDAEEAERKLRKAEQELAKAQKAVEAARQGRK